MGFLTFNPQRPPCSPKVQVHSSSITVLAEDNENFSTASSPHLQSPQPHSQSSQCALKSRVQRLFDLDLSSTHLDSLATILDRCQTQIFPHCSLPLLSPAQPTYWTLEKAGLSTSNVDTSKAPRAKAATSSSNVQSVDNSKSNVDNLVDFNDEQILFACRFCLARGFDTEQAMNMLRNYLEFRRDLRVDEEICPGGKSETRQRLKESYPSNYYGVTKSGLPIYLDRPGLINIKELATVDEKDLEQAWIQSYEHMQQVVLPACSLACGRRISRGITILDLDGIGISTFTAKTRSLLSRMIKISQDYYPESMDKMFIIRAPFVFNTVWRFVKPLLDKATVDKISVLPQKGDKLLDELRQHIDDEYLPPFLRNPTDKEWVTKPKGPWTDPDVLNSLQALYPSIAPELLYLESDANVSISDSPEKHQSPQDRISIGVETPEVTSPGMHPNPSIRPAGGLMSTVLIWCKAALFGT